MNVVIYKTSHATARLTTESPASHYGIPVLEITDRRPGHEGTQVFGWGDVLPSGMTGAGFVRAVAAGRSTPVPTASHSVPCWSSRTTTS